MAADATKLIVDNRRARFNYDLLERIEAGIVLTGTEVKSLRAGKLNLVDSFCHVDSDGAMYLVGAHIAPYLPGSRFNPDPARPRKLLLHKGEIERLDARVREKGLTLIPTRVYFKKGRVKVEVALARGKKLHDKRESIKARDLDQELRRSLVR